jgi:integrase
MKKAGRGWYVFWRADRRRWVLQYAGPAGREVQKTIETDVALTRTKRRDAEAWASAWLAEQSIDPTRALERRREDGRTLGEVAELWFALRASLVKAGHLAAATHQDSRGNIRLHVLPAVVGGRTLGERPIADIDTPLCRAWLRGFDTRSASTVRNTVFAFRRLLDDAMVEEWTRHPHNPMKSPAIERELPPLPDAHATAEGRAGKALDLAVAQALLGGEAVPLHRRVRYALALTTGARDGELSGLTWADVTLTPGGEELRITKALSLKGPGGYSTMGRTKTGRGRSFPLHPAAIAALREWQDEGYRVLVGRPPTPSSPVLPAAHAMKHGEANRPQSARALRADLDAVGHPLAVRFHDLRATFITWMNRALVDERLIRRFVGHAGKSVAERHYIHTDRAEMVEALARLALTWPSPTPDGALGGAAASCQKARRTGRRPSKPPTTTEPPTYANTTIDDMQLFDIDAGQWSGDATVLKTADGASCPGVRIPPPPPENKPLRPSLIEAAQAPVLAGARAVCSLTARGASIERLARAVEGLAQLEAEDAALNALFDQPLGMGRDRSAVRLASDAHGCWVLS